MKNKYLITLLVPSLEAEYDVYIPNNKKFGLVKEKLLSTIVELSNGTFQKTIQEVEFIDRDSGKYFPTNVYVKDTGIKNGTKIIVM